MGAQTTVSDYHRQPSYTIIDNFLRLNQSTLLNYLRLVYTTILKHIVLNDVRQPSIISMAILFNYKDKFDTVFKQS